jgi:hypothetical protein
MMNTDRDWDDMIRGYAEDNCAYASCMRGMLVYLKDAGYVKAGLYGGTSMHDLCLSQSRSIFNGDPKYHQVCPRLRIGPCAGWFHGPILCRIMYEDGSEKPWEVIVMWSSLIERVERVLTKRLRWFKKGEIRDRSGEGNGLQQIDV